MKTLKAENGDSGGTVEPNRFGSDWRTPDPATGHATRGFGLPRGVMCAWLVFVETRGSVRQPGLNGRSRGRSDPFLMG